MNSYMQGKWAWIEGSHGLRSLLLENIHDADLASNIGGQTMTLGALCREMGETEYSYIQSLKTFQQDLSYRNTDATLESSVAHLTTWYTSLDEELKTTVAAFSDEDFKKNVARSSTFSASIDMQLDIYLQALLIFFGKLTVYLRAMNKPLSPSIKEYIG